MNCLRSFGQQLLTLPSLRSVLSLRLPLDGSQPTTVTLFGRLIDQVRYSPPRRRIRGHPRPPLPFKDVPWPHQYNFIPILPKDGHYTTKSLEIRKLGGRNPETGRVVVRTRGGGNKKKFRWVQMTRTAPEDGVVEERVYNVRYDPLRSALIALVGTGGEKRWIIASQWVKPGDIIKTFNILPRNPVVANEGDAWPVGALPIGTNICCIEKCPGEGASYCVNAGTSAKITTVRKDMVVVKLPSKQEIGLDKKCMAVVGRVSNARHNTIQLLCPQRRRWLGFRPRSGLWHRKDGYCGRKVRPPKPLQLVSKILPKRIVVVKELHMLTD